MQKLTCIVIILVFLISGCSPKTIDDEKNNNVKKELKVKDSDGSILQTYYGDKVDSISADMKQETWRILPDGISNLEERYIMSFNEKVDERGYKKDVTVDYIFSEDMAYVKVVIYAGMPGDTYYELPEEVQSSLKKIFEVQQ